MDIQIVDWAYHRNGISGEPFYVFHFEDAENGPMIATVFLRHDFMHGEDGYLTNPKTWPFHNPCVAVLSLEKLPNIGFGPNSWRGDNYAPALYEVIYEAEREAV